MMAALPVPLFFATALLLSVLSGRAENSPGPVITHQVTHGRYCAHVTQETLKDANMNCHHPDPDRQRDPVWAWEIFEATIFNISAAWQVQKNQCHAQRLQALMNDPELLNQWTAHLITAWIRFQKGQAILQRCQAINPSRTPQLAFPDESRPSLPAESLQFLKESKDNLLGKAPKFWRDFCGDPAKVAALRSSQALFLISVPIVSHPDFFKIVNKHRHLLRKGPPPGRPVTDQDLLGTDLRTGADFSFDGDQKFQEALVKKLAELATDRRKMAKEIGKAETRGHYKLSPDLKDYIFNDGTVKDILIKNKLMSASFRDFKSMKPDDLSAGAFCLLTKYEPSFMGESLELLASTLSVAGLTFPIVRAFLALEKASPLKAVKESLAFGFSAASTQSLMDEVARACPISRDESSPRKAKIARARQTDDPKQLAIYEKLPSTIGYAVEELNIDQRLTPACKTNDYNDLISDPSFEPNCLLDSAMALAPFYALPPLLAIDAL